MRSCPLGRRVAGGASPRLRHLSQVDRATEIRSRHSATVSQVEVCSVMGWSLSVSCDSESVFGDRLVGRD